VNDYFPSTDTLSTIIFLLDDKFLNDFTDSLTWLMEAKVEWEHAKELLTISVDLPLLLKLTWILDSSFFYTWWEGVLDVLF